MPEKSQSELYSANTELIRRIKALEEKLPEKELLQRALEGSEMRYRRLFESAQDGILILEADTGLIVDANPFLLKLLGYDYAELCGKQLWEIGEFKDIAASKESFEILQQTEYMRYDDLPLETRRGHVVQVEFVSNVYLVDAKKVIQCNIRDITLRKMASDERERNEKRLQVLVDILQHPSESISEFLDYALSQAIQVTDSKIGYLYHYSEDRKEFVLNSWSKDVMAECAIPNPPTHYELDKTGIWGEAVRQRKPFLINDFGSPNPLRKGYPAGHVHLSRFITVPVFKDKAIVGVIGLANKETDYNETDILQASLLTEAVWKVAERKRAEDDNAKTQIQLQQAQKMEAVGRLAGGVAHDFNNLLTIINGMAEISISELKPLDPLISNLEGILEAGKRAADLTRQLLSFARLQVVCPRELNLNEAVTSIEKMLHRLIGEDIVLTWKPGTNIWPVYLDPSQVDQILANLVVNARDAIVGNGTIAIETSNALLDEVYCSIHAGTSPGEYALLTVSDTGIGMDRTTLSKIFEPFFTTKAVGKGTGLGLATVYGIVNQAGGSIYAYSEPGQGTTFHIYLPRWKGGPTASIIRDDSPKLLRGSETILLVEDEVRVLQIGRNILTRQGYRVLTSVSPDEALMVARNEPGTIHLLATDVVMPGMNGRELYEALKKQRPKLRCLFLSGYTADVITQRGVLPEGINFLHKPYTINGLAAKVRSVLDEESTPSLYGTHS